jgi:hypothetical protein
MDAVVTVGSLLPDWRQLPEAGDQPGKDGVQMSDVAKAAEHAAFMVLAGHNFPAWSRDDIARLERAIGAAVEAGLQEFKKEIQERVDTMEKDRESGAY